MRKEAAVPKPKKASRRPLKPAPAAPAPSADTPTELPALPPGPCVAAIGASAGGFEAIRSFFDAMPPDSGIAFVVIQHLHPTQKSLAAELFGKRTTMLVVPAEDGMRVAPNHVYTVPANTYPSIRNGVLHLAAPKEHSGPRLPIDHFLASLGEDQRERAIGIILSGSGSDGAVGLKSIAAAGGIVLVQDPETAQFDGMPASAIATGLANYILPVAKMPEVLVGYAHHPYVADAARPATVAESEEAALDIILELVRGRLGYNFSGYKKTTLLRRIQRRMGLRSITSFGEYAGLLRKSPEEISALFKDMLIGVTEFFRDPEAWGILGTEVIAPLVAAKPRGEPIRVWMPGTATGEEAYSLAILLIERLKQAGKRCPAQIFATDTNEEALQVGRAGLYPSGIAARMPAERLSRFFLQSTDNHHYQVSKELRESVVFGQQNVVADPPFSRLDLIVCRNLLIYLESDIQKKVVSMFHFALRPGGYLFLGSAESLGPYDDLFKPISKKWRIYMRKGVPHLEPLDLAPGSAEQRLPAAPAGPRRGASRLTQLTNVAQQLLLDRFAPAAVLVSSRNETLYFCGPVENYVLRPRGAPTQDLLAQVRDGLRSRLRGALREAAAREATVTIRDARVKRDGSFLPVRLTVTPAGVDGEGGQLLLVVFEDEPKAAGAGSAKSDESTLVRQLEEELRATKDDLQNTIERLETSNEELKVSNEEVVSVNEELQSINEELESSKEELQSLNEELTTVNQQLQGKVAELERANADLKNLLASSEIATICLDRDYRIRWFTPAMRSVFNVMAGDVGRPISDFAAALSGGALLDDCAAVLEKLAPVQRELRLEDGRWHLRRVVPYRGEEDRIDGVVVTFTDVTETRLTLEAAAADQRRAAAALEEKVRERTAQLRALTVELSLAEEQERRSLAQDLHDDLGQVLAIVKLKLTSLHATRLGAGLKGALKEIENLVDQSNKSVRSLALQLSPTILHTLGLVPALEWLIEEIERAYGLAVKLRDDGAPKPLDETVRTTLFRAVRELLINVAKHAGTGHAEVSCLRSDGRIVLEVNDSGHGFDYQKAISAPPGTGGFGLISVRERLGFIGGEMQVASKPGDGTTVTLIAPLEAPQLAKKGKK